MPIEVKAKSSPEDKHDFDVNAVIFHKGFIYSGADDGKIIKWDDNIKKISECQAHPCSIYSLAAIEETIYSCSNDGTVKAWTLDLKEKSTIVENTAVEFWKLAVSDGVLFAGDDKGGIMSIINDKPHAMYEILEGIKDMQADGKTLFTGKDIDITVTTIGDGPKPQFATKKVMQGRAPITLAKDKLIFVDIPATGLLIHENNSDGQFKPVTMKPAAHSMIINAVAGQREQSTAETVFYSGSWDKTIKKWKIADGKCDVLETIDVGLVVNALMVDPNGRLFGGLADGFVIRVQ